MINNKMTLTAMAVAALLSGCGGSSSPADNSTDESIQAFADNVETTNGTHVDINVLANDQGKNLMVSSVGENSAGQFTLVGTDTIRVDMNDDFAGTVTIPYTVVSESGLSSQSELTIAAYQAREISGKFVFALEGNSEASLADQPIYAKVGNLEQRFQSNNAGEFSGVLRTLDTSSPIAFYSDFKGSNDSTVTFSQQFSSLANLTENPQIELDALTTAYGILKQENLNNKSDSDVQFSANQLFETAAALEFISLQEEFSLGDQHASINDFVSDTAAYNAYFSSVATDPAQKEAYAASHNAVMAMSSNKVKIGKMTISDNFYLMDDILPGGFIYGTTNYDLRPSFDGVVVSNAVRRSFTWEKAGDTIRVLYSQDPEDLGQVGFTPIDNTTATEEQIEKYIEYTGGNCCVSARGILAAEEISLVGRVDGKRIVNVNTTRVTTYDPIELERSREVEVVGEDGETTTEVVIDRETIVLPPKVDIFDTRNVLIDDKQTHVNTFTTEMLNERTWILPKFMKGSPLVPTRSDVFDYSDAFRFLPNGRGAALGAFGFAQAEEFDWTLNDENQLVLRFLDGATQTFRVYGSNDNGLNIISDQYDENGDVSATTAGIAVEPDATMSFSADWLSAPSATQYWQTSINASRPEFYVDGEYPLELHFGWEFFRGNTGNRLGWEYASLNDPEFEFGERIERATPFSWTLSTPKSLTIEYSRIPNENDELETPCGSIVCYSRSWNLVNLSAASDNFIVVEAAAVSIQGGEFETYIPPRLVKYSIWDRPVVDGEIVINNETRKVFLSTGNAGKSDSQ